MAALKKTLDQISFGNPLRFQPIEMRNDKKFILECVRARGDSLEYASDELKNDKDVVLSAVRNDGYALKFGSSRLKKDEEVVLEAVIENPWALKFSDKSFHDDEDIAKEAVKNGTVLSILSKYLQNDREIVAEAMKTDPKVLMYASKEIQNDAQFVGGVMREIFSRSEYTLFQDRSIEERSDKNLALEAVKKKGVLMKEVEEDLKKDFDVVLTAVKQDGGALEFASESMKNNYDIVLTAVRENGIALQYAGEELRSSRDFVLELVKFNGTCLEYVSEELKNDKEVVMEAVKQYGISVISSSQEMRKDKDIVMIAVKQYGWCLQYASDELRNDKDVVLVAISNVETGRAAYSHIGDELLRSSSTLTKLKALGGNYEKYLEAVGDSPSLFSTPSPLKITGSSPFDDEWEEIVLRLIPTLLKGYEVPKKLKKNFRSRGICNYSSTVDEEMERNDLRELSSSLSSKFSFKNMVFHRRIGKGVYGSAYLCSVLDVTGVLVAKIYHGERYFLSSRAKKKEVVKRDVLPIGYHPNIVSILSYKECCKLDIEKLPDYETNWKELRDEGMVMEGGVVLMKYHRMDLESYLGGQTEILSHFDDYLEDPMTFFIVIGVLRGLFHLHKNMIVHRDLHTGNIFINVNEGRVWVGDFGCALDLRGNKGFLVHKKHEQMFSIFTSDYFKRGGFSGGIAPEIRNFDESIDEFLDYSKSDLYSLGVICKLLLERNASKRNNSFHHLGGVVEELQDYCNKGYIFRFISNFSLLLLEADLNKRISFEDAIRMCNTRRKKEDISTVISLSYCLENGLCTYLHTKEISLIHFSYQKFFNCKKCFPSNFTKVICESCANLCHKGHEGLIEDHESPEFCYCDCGESGYCKCMDI